MRIELLEGYIVLIDDNQATEGGMKLIIIKHIKKI